MVDFWKPTGAYWGLLILAAGAMLFFNAPSGGSGSTARLTAQYILRLASNLFWVYIIAALARGIYLNKIYS